MPFLINDREVVLRVDADSVAQYMRDGYGPATRTQVNRYYTHALASQPPVHEPDYPEAEVEVVAPVESTEPVPEFVNADLSHEFVSPE